jgi:hypothetical protein
MRVKEEKADDAGDVLLLLHPEFIELLAFRAGARNLGTCTVRQHRACLTKVSNNSVASDVQLSCSQVSRIVYLPLVVSKYYLCCL